VGLLREKGGMPIRQQADRRTGIVKKGRAPRGQKARIHEKKKETWSRRGNELSAGGRAPPDHRLFSLRIGMKGEKNFDFKRGRKFLFPKNEPQGGGKNCNWVRTGWGGGEGDTENVDFFQKSKIGEKGLPSVRGEK